MKHLKTLGIAAVAALGLMAFVGAGTASATTFSTDSAGTVKYGVGTEIHATLKTGTSATLETGSTVIATCTGSTTKGSIDTNTGTWVGGKISALTWEGCSQTTDNVSLGRLDIMKTGTDEGEVVSQGSQVTLGVFGTTCTYGTGEGIKLGTIKGGTEPVLTISAALPRTAGNFLCPASGTWTATYIITGPHALHFVE